MPHHLPGTNPYLHEFADYYGLPYEATRGGAETLYPEYQKKIANGYHPPDHCERFCKCTSLFDCNLTSKMTMRQNPRSLHGAARVAGVPSVRQRHAPLSPRRPPIPTTSQTYHGATSKATSTC